MNADNFLFVIQKHGGMWIFEKENSGRMWEMGRCDADDQIKAYIRRNAKKITLPSKAKECLHDDVFTLLRTRKRKGIRKATDMFWLILNGEEHVA